MLAIENADDARLAAFDPDKSANILLAGSRAATLKLTNQRAAGNCQGPVIVARTSWLDLPAARALADPATDLANPFQGLNTFRTDGYLSGGGQSGLGRPPLFVCLSRHGR